MIPKSSADSWDQAYGHLAPRERRAFGPGEREAAAIIQRWRPLGPNVSVVELGGGGGSFLLPFARLGCACYAIDFSPVGLEQARRLFEEEGYELNVISADLLKVTAEISSRFDVAVSYGLCEHFRGDDRLAIIRAHREVIRPGGVVMFSVPNRHSPAYQIWWGAARLLTRLGLARRLDVNIIDEWAFSPGELKRLARAAGLADVRVVGTPLLGDAVDMIGRAAQKFAFRLVGRGYRRPPRAHAMRSPVDDLLGSYLYTIGRHPA